MSKYHTIVGIDPSGSQELGFAEFIQIGDGEENVVYMYISGDIDIPSIDIDDLPDCECSVDEDCMCEYDEKLVNRVTKYYEDLGLDARVISMGSFISSVR